METTNLLGVPEGSWFYLLDKAGKRVEGEFQILNNRLKHRKSTQHGTSSISRPIMTAIILGLYSVEIKPEISEKDIAVMKAIKLVYGDEYVWYCRDEFGVMVGNREPKLRLGNRKGRAWDFEFEGDIIAVRDEHLQFIGTFEPPYKYDEQD